jgi:uncharacterized protein HemY
MSQQKDKNNVRLYLALGTVYVKSGALEKAEAYFQMALSFDNSVPVIMRVGYQYFYSECWDEYL